MSETWTLSELVEQVATHLASLPAPRNGQVRAVPDERTVRYYGTIGLLDKPAAMRGRTALYSRRHLAQVVAIKRMQSSGKSLAEIQTLWPALDDATLARMSGVQLTVVPPPSRPKPAREAFWKPGTTPRSSMPRPAAMSAPLPDPMPLPGPPLVTTTGPSTPVIGVVVPATSTGPSTPSHVVWRTEDRGVDAGATELRIALDGNVALSILVPDEFSLSSADIRAIRAAAAPLLEELARRQLSTNDRNGGGGHR